MTADIQHAGNAQKSRAVNDSDQLKTPHGDGCVMRCGVKYLGLPEAAEAAALAASDAKKAASPVSLPGPDPQSLGSPAMQIVLSVS